MKRALVSLLVRKAPLKHRLRAPGNVEMRKGIQCTCTCTYPLTRACISVNHVSVCVRLAGAVHVHYSYYNIISQEITFLSVVCTYIYIHVHTHILYMYMYMYMYIVHIYIHVYMYMS